MKHLLRNYTNRTPAAAIAVITFALLLSLLPLGNARALTPAFVQSNFSEVDSGTTNSVAFSKANGAGDLLVAYVVWSSGTSSASLSDSRGNAYASAGNATKWNGSNWSSQVFYAKNVAGGANTVKATFSSAISQFSLVYVHEYSGMDTASPLDTSVAAAGTAKAMNSGSVTTTNANDLIFGGGASSSTVTAKGTGFTTRSSGSGNMTEDKAVTTTGSYNATATQNGSAWVMQMVAFKAGTTTTDTTPPSVPGNLTATAVSPALINLSWTGSTDNVGVTGYKVFRNGTQVGTTTGTTYADSGLIPGTTYSYTVAAFDIAGNTSAQSGTASATTPVPPPDTTPPTVPGSLNATSVSTSEIDLSWSVATDNVGVTGYKIYRNGTLVTSVAGLSYKDTGLTAGMAYSYTVSAFDAAGNESAQSAPVSAATLAPDTTPPTVPTGLSVSGATPSQVTLNWSASTDGTAVTGYHVFRNGTQVATATNTSYQDTGLSANTTYVYTVSAFDAAGNESAQSSPVNGTTQPAPTFAFPAGLSTNHRYLVDQSGKPYMIVGDSPHSLAVNLTEAQAGTYFADRQAHGINAAWIQVLCDAYTGGRANGATYDGIVPFTTANDFSTPNPAYFQRLSDMVNLAAQHGITVFLDPVDTAGWQSQYESNGATKDFNFGQYLGNLFKNSPNVVWLNGNDYGAWPITADDADVTAIANGIKSVDSSHIQTVELNGTISSSLDDSNWQPIIGLNAAYTYYPTYDEVLHAYNQTPTIPTFMVEANYEFENNTGGPATTNETLRRQEYWTMLSGATGQLYGNSFTWDDSSWTDEQAHLDTPGVTQLQYMENLLASRPWYNLVPDQSHNFLTAGMGTYDSAQDDVLQSDYATAAVTADGSLGMVYVPTARTITVNLNLLAGAVNAQWYDPSNNTFHTIVGSPFAPASGSQQFTTPGTNADGNGDWVLVLDGNTNTTPDTTPPSVPAGLAVTSVAGTQASLSWAPSADNVSVAGYQVFRNGSLVGTTVNPLFTDSGLLQNTTYNYAVDAFDLAGNVSGQSAPLTVTTTNAAPPPATPTFVQINSATPQTAQTTVTVPYSLAQTSGDTNIVVVGFYNTAATVSSVTDTNGNTYTLAAPLTHSGSMYQAIYYARNIKLAPAGSNIVTVTFSKAVQFPDIRVTEYGGLDTTNPLDVTSSATGSAATANSGNLTTTASSELLFAAGSTSGVFTAAGSGYTLRVITNPDSDIVEDRDVTAAGTYSATASQSGDEVMQVVAFKAAE